MRTKLIGLGGLLVFLSLSVTGLFSMWKAAAALRQSAEQTTVVQSQDLAALVAGILNEKKWTAKGLASMSVLRTASEKVAAQGTENAETEIEALNRELLVLLRSMGSDYEGVFVADASGEGFAGTTPDGKTDLYKGVNIGERPYFQKAKTTGEAVIGEPVISKVSSQPVVVLAVPLKGSDGTFRGILGLTTRIDAIIETLSKTKVGKTGYAYMVDRQGIIISHPNKDLILKLDLSKTPGMDNLVQAMASESAGAADYVFNGEKKISGYAPVGINGWMVGATQPVSEFLQPVRQQVFGMLFIGAVALLLTLGVFFLFATKLTKPIMEAVHGLDEGADQVAAAASQVSGASQQLAEGTSEQAASLEETSKKWPP
jgi:methyl-accepting chemotaxis protein